MEASQQASFRFQYLVSVKAEYFEEIVENSMQTQVQYVLLNSFSFYELNCVFSAGKIAIQSYTNSVCAYSEYTAQQQPISINLPLFQSSQ